MGLIVKPSKPSKKLVITLLPNQLKREYANIPKQTRTNHKKKNKTHKSKR